MARAEPAEGSVESTSLIEPLNGGAEQTDRDDAAVAPGGMMQAVARCLI